MRLAEDSGTAFSVRSNRCCDLSSLGRAACTKIAKSTDC